VKDYLCKTFNELTEADLEEFLKDIVRREYKITEEAKGVKSNDYTQKETETVRQEKYQSEEGRSKASETS